MPNIMIRCPTTGTPVPTGLTTEKIKFESLSEIKIPLKCAYVPFCTHACFCSQWWSFKQTACVKTGCPL